MNIKTKKYVYLILKALTTVIAVANVSCAIHSLHKEHTQIFQFSIHGSNSTEFRAYEDNFDGTNFSGAIAVLVFNMLLTVGIFADIDLFSYIWLFLYGSFWLVAIFIAPETYQKLPGMSHFLTRVISQDFNLDNHYRPIIYTCLKLTCCLVIILLLVVRKQTLQTHSSSQTFIIRPSLKNKLRRSRTSNRSCMSSSNVIPAASGNIPTLSNEHVSIDSTPTFGRSLATISTVANTSSMNSTDTLVSEMTSTPSVVNSYPHHTTAHDTLITDVINKSNQSEDRSFDVLRSRI